MDSTLAFVAGHSGPGSSIVFDYIHAAALDGRQRRGEVSSVRRAARFTGEGLRFGIEEGTIAEFLTRRGFCDVVNLDGKALEARYCTGANEGRKVAPAYAIVHATVTH